MRPPHAVSDTEKRMFIIAMPRCACYAVSGTDVERRVLPGEHSAEELSHVMQVLQVSASICLGRRYAIGRYLPMPLIVYRSESI
eukprot:800318-Rhodomonas_salina.2